VSRLAAPLYTDKDRPQALSIVVDRRVSLTFFSAGIFGDILTSASPNAHVSVSASGLDVTNQGGDRVIQPLFAPVPS